MQILLDTNFLMLPAQHKVDIYKELAGELITLSNCVRELERLAKKKGKSAAQARIALQLARENVKIIDSGGTTDKALVACAMQKRCAVATNDSALIKSLKSHNIKIIRLRQKKYLVEQ